MAVTGPRMKIKTERFIKKLGKSGNRLQIAAAEALNDSTQEIDDTYTDRLRHKQTIRTKYTLNSVKTFKANPVRKSGEPRPLGKINAITGVRKMKGQDHYLLDLEEGGPKRGNIKTRNRVPIPLDTSRTGMTNLKPIAGANRLTKGQTQTLRAGGKKFGVPGDGFKSASQRFAILYNYKKNPSMGRFSGDVKKPFYFLDSSNKLGIFKFIRNKVRKIRNLENRSVSRKRTNHFRKSVKTLKPVDIQRRFVRNGERLIRDGM